MGFSLADLPDDSAEFLRRLLATHGDIAALPTHGRQVVLVFSPELNRAVLSQPDLFHSMFFPGRVTSGLLSINGPSHGPGSPRFKASVQPRRHHSIPGAPLLWIG